MRTRTLSLTVVAVFALLLGAMAAWSLSKRNTPITGPQLTSGTPLYGELRPLPDFSLLDQEGQPFKNDRLQDHWSFVFFGYTHCPDICPTTLAILKDTLQEIEQNDDHVRTQVVFITVDPEHDDPLHLKSYVKYFHPQFIGVTGTPAAINALTSDLGILHMKMPNPNDPKNYLINHTVTILLIGPEGHVVALFGAPHKAKSLADDFHTLRQYYKRS
jgi:protein SCO1/2